MLTAKAMEKTILVLVILILKKGCDKENFPHAFFYQERFFLLYSEKKTLEIFIFIVMRVICEKERHTQYDIEPTFYLCNIFFQ